jgi:hypothetical protein
MPNQIAVKKTNSEDGSLLHQRFSNIVDVNKRFKNHYKI